MNERHCPECEPNPELEVQPIMNYQGSVIEDKVSIIDTYSCQLCGIEEKKAYFYREETGAYQEVKPV